MRVERITAIRKIHRVQSYEFLQHIITKQR